MTATPMFMPTSLLTLRLAGTSNLVITLLTLALCQNFHSSWRLGAVATAVGSSSQRNHTYKPSDFVIVINTDQDRLPLTLASRPLRYNRRRPAREGHKATQVPPQAGERAGASSCVLPVASLIVRLRRFGIRTFIALDNETLVEQLNQRGDEHHETYAFFPNRYGSLEAPVSARHHPWPAAHPALLPRLYCTNRNISGPERDKPGDTRWQAAPFMAHAHYGRGSYRWLLLGDDDTLWFIRGRSPAVL